MNAGSDQSNLALGVTVLVRCGGRERIGVITRLESQNVVVQWTHTRESG